MSVYVCSKSWKTPGNDRPKQSSGLYIVTCAKISHFHDLLSVKVPNEIQRTSPPLKKCIIFLIYGLYIVKEGELKLEIVLLHQNRQGGEKLAQHWERHRDIGWSNNLKALVIFSERSGCSWFIKTTLSAETVPFSILHLSCALPNTWLSLTSFLWYSDFSPTLPAMIFHHVYSSRLFCWVWLWSHWLVSPWCSSHLNDECWNRPFAPVTDCEPVVVSFSGWMTHSESHRTSPDKHRAARDICSFPPKPSRQEKNVAPAFIVSKYFFSLCCW